MTFEAWGALWFSSHQETETAREVLPLNEALKKPQFCELSLESGNADSVVSGKRHYYSEQ